MTRYMVEASVPVVLTLNDETKQIEKVSISGLAHCEPSDLVFSMPVAADTVVRGDERERVIEMAQWADLPSPGLWEREA